MSTLSEFKKQFVYVYSQNVIWGDMDAFGHLNNVMFYRYIESARLEYLMLTKALDHGLLTVITFNSCNYLRPVTYPDTLHIGVGVNEMRNSGFKMHYTLFSQAQQKVVAHGEAVVVMMDGKTNTKAPIPEQLRTAIEQLEASKN